MDDTLEDVQRGDFVTYTMYFNHHGTSVMQQGAGYLEEIGEDYYIVLDGQRTLRIDFDKGTVELRAKQHRLDV